MIKLGVYPANARQLADCQGRHRRFDVLYYSQAQPIPKVALLGHSAALPLVWSVRPKP